jgi:hypothetical protein
MANVFLSYAREDRAQAERLARALGARNWTVWWDREMVAGENIHQVIQRELDAAGAVVVLWSKSSCDSDWVKDEANAASKRGTLVPASLDGTEPPLGFGSRHAADLRDWDGRRNDGFESLCKGIERKVDTPAGPPQIVLAAPHHGNRIWLAVLVALLVSGGWFVARRSGDTTSAPSTPPASLAPRDVRLDGRELADVVAGTYLGAVVADARGHSQSDVTLVITKIGPRRVRVRADYDRLRTVEVDLTRAGDDVLSAGGPSLLKLENDTLDFSPDGEVTFAGKRRQNPEPSKAADARSFRQFVATITLRNDSYKDKDTRIIVTLFADGDRLGEATSGPERWRSDDPHTMTISAVNVPLDRCPALRFSVEPNPPNDSAIVELGVVGTTDDGETLPLVAPGTIHPIGKRYERIREFWAVTADACRHPDGAAK